ncbi:MAG: Coenzyme F420 hydrogenase/dehydrogenase, beta subunit C-terminal domain [Candidatus Krumholzibacteria bacterium]|nr:Coenzyme F420 hydrogenase/dehydrogenase, beta subunit C-terminal domain [Candidatus Krumholzibacteria bacterium]
MSAKLPVEILIETVVETGLCTRCGTCVGACPAKNLGIGDPLGACLPVAAEACTSCGMCLDGCPGASVDFAPLEKGLFGDAVPNRLLGVVRGAYLAHASDAIIRRNGSSGGVVTAMLLDLVGRGESKGAVLFAPHREEPWRGWGRIASSPEEIAAAAQSRYHLSPLNTALGEMRDAKGDFAYVGIPCQIHGLRKLQAALWRPAGIRLSPIIGIYCGNNLYYEATRVMLKKLGVRRPEDVAALSYREGVWPGSFVARTADGVVRSISKLDFNQVIPFYINRRCLFCIDLANELADLSVGDGWAKEGSGGDGWSVVLVRTETGERVFDGAVRSGVLEAEPITVEAAERMHSHAFDLKKTGAFLRLGLWKGWGCAVPRYDRPGPRVTAGRRFFEVVLSLQFAAASSWVGRAVFRVLPARALGRLFRFLRKRWMRSTARR